jgi:hypothetical protein
LLGTKDISKAALQDGISEIDKRLDALEAVQGEYELSLDDESDIETEIDSAADYREGVRAVRVRASELLLALEDADSEESVASGSALSSGTKDVRVQAKLPKLTLPKFGGKVLEWSSFWDQFLAIIDHSEMAEINKFAYLKSLLEGEAADAISGLTLSAGNYTTACDILTERFGRAELVRFSHIQELLNIGPLARQASCSDLRKLHDKILSHVRGLENLGINGKEYGVFLTPLVLSCLPPGVRMEWARDSAGKEGNLEWLLDFLETEIQNRERCNTFKGLVKVDSKETAKVNKSSKSPSTASALSSVSSASRRGAKSARSVVSSVSNNLCEICGRRHLTSKCWDLVNSSPEQRVEVMKKKGLCFRCVCRGHMAASCTAKCSQCQGSHHFLLCKRSPVAEGAAAPAAQNVSLCSRVKSTQKSVENVLLQTAVVEVRGKNGPVKARLLFDTGADRSYVSRKFVETVCPQFVGSESVSYGAFGSGSTGRAEMRNIFRLALQGSTQLITVVATEIPVICAPLTCRNVGNLLQSFGHLEFANRYDTDEKVSVDILIGLDSYWQLVKPNAVAVTETVVAQETVFGWILSGIVGGSRRTTSHQLLCLCDVPDSTIRNFWEIQDSKESESLLESPVFTKFAEQLNMKDGRYEVALPWKSDASQLVDNFEGAFGRLKSLTRKLNKDSQLRERYDAVFQEMEAEHIVEEVPSDQVDSQYPTFYLPHRPVVRESSTSTKVRPVFDASAKGPNNISLNDCLETGPNLVPCLVDILLRFRRWPVAVVADIKKAFLQISCRKEDQDVHRFLLESDGGGLRIMRILRVPFGNRSSPFILNATIKCHLAKFAETSVVRELKENLYVDDWLSGANSEAEAKSNVEEAIRIMSQANMDLTKWESNRSFVVDKSEPSDYVKVLGLGWRSVDDCFFI